jgi:multimeric flavodoxin WrbA
VFGFGDALTKLSVIYYSATGHGTKMAREVADAGRSAGAEVRLRRVVELSEMTDIAAAESGPSATETSVAPRTLATAHLLLIMASTYAVLSRV